MCAKNQARPTLKQVDCTECRSERIVVEETYNGAAFCIDCFSSGEHREKQTAEYKEYSDKF